MSDRYWAVMPEATVAEKRLKIQARLKESRRVAALSNIDCVSRMWAEIIDELLDELNALPEEDP